MENTATWQRIRPRVFEILITAILSALIAMLQNFLTAYSQDINTHTNPEAAAGIGAGIRTAWISLKYRC
jgi:hypothetical protein